MITEQAGDTISWDIPLVDGLTRDTVESSSVADAWVSFGKSNAWSLTDNELQLQADRLQLVLAPEVSRDWSGIYQVWAKVRLKDGRVSTILNGEQVLLQITPLTSRV